MSDQVRVYVAEDCLEYREFLCAHLEMNERITVVGQATDGQTAVDEILALRPDVAIIDLMMPVRDGFSVIEGLTTVMGKEKPILFCSSACSDDNTTHHALSIGADYFFIKPGTRVIDNSVCERHRLKKLFSFVYSTLKRREKYHCDYGYYL